MAEVKSYQELQEQKPFRIFCFSSLKSQEAVFVEAGIKTVSNILLFLSRSSLSSPPPFSTLSLEDIAGHLKSSKL